MTLSRRWSSYNESGASSIEKIAKKKCKFVWPKLFGDQFWSKSCEYIRTTQARGVWNIWRWSNNQYDTTECWLMQKNCQKTVNGDWVRFLFLMVESFESFAFFLKTKSLIIFQNGSILSCHYTYILFKFTSNFSRFQTISKFLLNPKSFSHHNNRFSIIQFKWACMNIKPWHSIDNEIIGDFIEVFNCLFFIQPR